MQLRHFAPDLPSRLAGRLHKLLLKQLWRHVVRDLVENVLHHAEGSQIPARLRCRGHHGVLNLGHPRFGDQVIAQILVGRVFLVNIREALDLGRDVRKVCLKKLNVLLFQAVVDLVENAIGEFVARDAEAVNDVIDFFVRAAPRRRNAGLVLVVLDDGVPNVVIAGRPILL